jgi:hypothetical protein
MHLSHNAAVGSFQEVHLGYEMIQVGYSHGMILFDNDVASTVQTQTLAKWHMHIDGKWCG